jgi:hypothetical protein
MCYKLPVTKSYFYVRTGPGTGARGHDGMAVPHGIKLPNPVWLEF